MTSALHQLAHAAGLQVDWEDATSHPQRVSDDNLRRVLESLGYPAASEADIAESLERAKAEAALCQFALARRNQPFVLPSGLPPRETAELNLESGETRRLTLERTTRGMRLPPIAEVGYHTLRLGDAEIRLAVAPERCLGVADLAGRERIWGATVQIPSLRGEQARAFGDFAALADAARQFGQAGAGALAISPTHALFPSDPARYSPYAPSSRLFLNILFADPGLIGHPVQPADATGDLIDWQQAIPARIAQLRAAFAARGGETERAVRAYRARMGEDLERHAHYDALHAHFHPGGARGWQDWPSEFHDPASEAVARFARQHAEEVDFFAFAQWLAAESLNRAQGAARDAGMAVGLIADLAVGMDAGGSHAWSRPDDLLKGLSVGAPPDLLGPDGQDWGLTTFSPAALKRSGFEPFIATLRAALDHAGGIRMDHVLGLNRLWIVPHGGTAADGAYLAYPLEEMLGILAIESHRAGAIVIGEDLGTVPPGLRPKLEDDHVLGMRVMWFERDADGGYVPPSRWQKQAVAMTGTHDLPTIAGWWQGRDIEWTWKLGRSSGHVGQQEALVAREEERADLWHAFVAAGAASGDMPSGSEPGPVLDAAMSYVASSPCELALVPLEDLAGIVEQPNIPGTIDEHPNWRRRMPETTGQMLGKPAIRQRLTRLGKGRA